MPIGLLPGLAERQRRMCRCGECVACKHRACQAGLRRLNEPLETCPVWQRVVCDPDARFPFPMVTMFDLVNRYFLYDVW